MDLKKIETIIEEPIREINEISYGYTNQIYSINNRYIFKSCVNENNYRNFQRASEFCKKYYGIVNCPKVIYSCLEPENKNMWQIEEKAKGVNLSFKWGELNNEEKEEVIGKICESLRSIHNIPIGDVFESTMNENDWKEKFRKDIEKKINSLIKKGMNYNELYSRIRNYVGRNIESLDETDFKICHTDMHFDNILIDDEKNITVLDYDRLRIASIDYELNIFNVMQKTPKLIVNDKIKKKIKDNEYTGILNLLSEKYNEMFEFKDLDKRLNIYGIKHYLGLLSVVKDKNTILKVLNDIINEKVVEEHER